MRPTSGQVQATRELLGLTTDDLAALLGVRSDTARRWESGRDPIPVRVGDELDDLVAATGTAVTDLIDDLGEVPAVRVWRTTEDYHAHDVVARASGWPARWWRHVAARAVAHVPGSVIVSAPTMVVALIDEHSAAKLTIVATRDSDLPDIAAWVREQWVGLDGVDALADQLDTEIRAGIRAVLVSARDATTADEPGRGDFGRAVTDQLSIDVAVTQL